MYPVYFSRQVIGHQWWERACNILLPQSVLDRHLSRAVSSHHKRTTCSLVLLLLLLMQEPSMTREILHRLPSPSSARLCRECLSCRWQAKLLVEYLGCLGHPGTISQFLGLGSRKDSQFFLGKYLEVGVYLQKWIGKATSTVISNIAELLSDRGCHLSIEDGSKMRTYWHAYDKSHRHGDFLNQKQKLASLPHLLEHPSHPKGY